MSYLEKWRNLGSSCNSKSKAETSPSPGSSQSSHCRPASTQSHPSPKQRQGQTAAELSFCFRGYHCHSISPPKRMAVSFGSNFFLPTMGVMDKVPDCGCPGSGKQQKLCGSAMPSSADTADQWAHRPSLHESLVSLNLSADSGVIWALVITN